MASIDYTAAAKLLATLFTKAEQAFHGKQSPAVSAPVERAAATESEVCRLISAGLDSATRIAPTSM